MKTNNFALHNGKIVYVPDVPEEKDFGNNLHYSYERALQSAIASGIEVENQEEVRHKLLIALNWNPHPDEHRFEANVLYPLQCRVEFIYQFKYTGTDHWLNCHVSVYQEHQRKDSYGAESRKLARVTFEQPEKKGTSLGWGGPLKDGPDTPHEIQRKAAGQEQERSLKLLADLLIRYKVRHHLNVNGFGYSEIEREIVKLLTRKP